MIRSSYVTPGYDCRRECSHGRPPGFHGLCGDEWHFVVQTDDKRIALTLDVLTSIFPATVGPETTRNLPRGVDLTIHVADPLDRKALLTQDPVTRQVLIEDKCDGHPWRKCEHVVGGQCQTYASTSLGAEEFWRLHGQIDLAEKQGNVFWAYLAAKIPEANIREEIALVAPYRVCAHCQGHGTVKPQATFPSLTVHC